MTSIPKEPEEVMKRRGGSVLGKKTILKSDHFPGCHNKRLHPHIDGAPNYRQAESLHVHGVAIPTTDGIRNVLKHIGARAEGKKAQVLWINLREEPVVYINGRPFVLRDVERPFSNLEYTGINRERVEQMEARLKEDILMEAARYGNKILVTDELPDGQMVDQWESVSCNSVKAPLEVYQELQVEGYLVDYERVPITDEKSPKERDFDILVHKISQADVNTEIIFNCQMGRGRTTTGMVIATLFYLNRIGASDMVEGVSNQLHQLTCKRYYASMNLGHGFREGHHHTCHIDHLPDFEAFATA
ncbi:Paladin [Glycine soja]|uniref:Paladin n=1 Tax=Glycine soja TaxID=3848 RepID=A0A445F2K0_GLYSO|nr:Paladin [Glycine soja]